MLAKCHERIGGESGIDTAMQYLEKLIDSAAAESGAHPEQLALAANAACRLGRLCGVAGDHERAIASFTRGYALAEKIGDLELVQQLQVSLGMARANALIGHVARGYVHNTAKDLAVALQWCSLRRDGFTGGAVATGFEP